MFFRVEPEPFVLWREALGKGRKLLKAVSLGERRDCVVDCGGLVRHFLLFRSPFIGPGRRVRLGGYVDRITCRRSIHRQRGPITASTRAELMASMEKIARVLAENHAQLWINHDKPSSEARRHAPEFYQ